MPFWLITQLYFGKDCSAYYKMNYSTLLFLITYAYPLVRILVEFLVTLSFH